MYAYLDAHVCFKVRPYNHALDRGFACGPLSDNVGQV